MAVEQPAENTDSLIQTMIDVVTKPIPLRKGACPRCRGRNGYFVGHPDGVRVYVRCADCKGTGRAR